MSRLQYAMWRVLLRFLVIGGLLGGFVLVVIGFVIYLFVFDSDRFREIVYDASTGDPVQDLQSPNENRRRVALKELAQGPVDKSNREIVAKIKTQLRDPYRKNRQAAVDALVAWGGPEDAGVIIDLLEAGERIDKERYYDALVQLGGTDAAEFLALQLADPWNRPLAIDDLIALGELAETPVSEFVSHEDPHTRVAACQVLAEIGTADSLATLSAAASDEDPSVSKAAAQAEEAIRTRLNDTPDLHPPSEPETEQTSPTPNESSATHPHRINHGHTYCSRYAALHSCWLPCTSRGGYWPGPSSV